MRIFICYDCNYTWELPHGEGGRGVDQRCPECGSQNVHRVGSGPGGGKPGGGWRDRGWKGRGRFGGGWGRRGWGFGGVFEGQPAELNQEHNQK